MSAYRAGHGSAPVEDGHEDGLVDELIKQFADPLAFYRELVQNSIDAGAKSIAVALSFEVDPDTTGADPLGTLDVAVRDDGCGMSREILEEQLTVLFRSGKEGVEGKIGKFGVGFVSVLAVAPQVVIVRTSEGRGVQWSLQLAGDQSYELFRADAQGPAGTTVTLRLRRRRAEVADLVHGSVRALTKWCRHVEIPVRFVANVGGGEVIQELRIDRPLGLDALVSVRITEGSTTVVAGLPSDGEPYLGFFNRGLLLYETQKDLLGAVMISVQDSNLEHTLSRDNVRRDRHYERAMRVARSVVERHLTRHAHDVLGELARRERTEPPIEALLASASNAGLDLDADAIAIPLLEPFEGATTVPLSALSKKRVYLGVASDGLTAGAARSGARVVDLSVAHDRAAYVRTLSALAGASLPDVRASFTLATAADASGADLALLDRVKDLLGTLGRRPNGPRLARFAGANSTRLYLAGGDGELPIALTEEDGQIDPFRLLARPVLLLNADYDAVGAARRLAVTDLEAASALLTRVILLWRGELDDDGADDAWLEASAEAVPT